MNFKEKFLNAKQAYLIMADGTVYRGNSFGATGTTIGEVVFTTTMTGYQETLTDPSYYGQIVTQTFPLIGNYGVNDWDQESNDIWLKGYIVREWCEEPSNFRSQVDVDQYLKSQNIIGLYGIDTRALTKKIRKYGVMNGAITTEYPEDEAAMQKLLAKINNFAITDAIKSVSIKERRAYNLKDGKCRVILMDYGYKRNIRRSLNERGCDVMVVPYDTSLEEIEALNPDGIMLSNGPGNPAEDKKAIDNLKEILTSDIPILGICLGHQLMALAMGGRTEKLKYGHRGANQPVMDVANDRVFVTSQNHGYAVISDSVSEDVGQLGYYNVNDGSCEGMTYKRNGTFTTQFHPEAAAGPRDTQDLFDKFVDYMMKYKESK